MPDPDFQTHFVLDDEPYNAFVARLKEPARKCPKLRRLMNTATPWEAKPEDKKDT